MSTVEAVNLNDEVVVLMRKCGHFLHHSAAGRGVDNSKLLSVLNEEEKESLKAILNKCLQDWQKNAPADANVKKEVQK